MTASAVTEEGEETEWMKRLSASFGPIERVLTAMPGSLKEHKQFVFERLFDAALQDARGTAGRRGPTKVVATPLAPSGADSFQRFLVDYGITMDTLANIVDVESGQVLSRNLATTKSESQRRLAALLSLVNAHKTGEFSVTRDALVDACKTHGVYDSANFASNMTTDYKGSVIFIRDANGVYKVTRPGEEYVADVVRFLLKKPEEGASV